MTRFDIDAPGPLDDTDVEILHRMASLFAATDPVPAGLVDDIKFALTVQALHAEVAELQRLGEASELAFRSTDYTRTETVSFTTDYLSATVTISDAMGGAARIDGWLSGTDVRRVALREAGRTRSVAPDEAGFVFVDVARGLVQLVMFPADPDLAPVVTPHLEV